MNALKLPFAFIPSLLFFATIAHSYVSIGAGVLASSGEPGDHVGYEIGLEKVFHEFRFIGIYSGIRSTYLSVQLKTRFVRNAPHHLFYFGVPAGVRFKYRSKMFEPFIGIEGSLDYLAFDYRENKSDLFCDISGDCRSYGPEMQPEKYSPFVLRVTPEFGSIIHLNNVKIRVSTGLRMDATAFESRGHGETRQSRLVAETGLAF